MVHVSNWLHNSQSMQRLVLLCNMLRLIVWSGLTGTSSKLPGVLKTHLGRGWMPAEPEWGAPLSDGRWAGAGWSPHWCTRCSHHARRTWRRRTGAHCGERERWRKELRWVIWDHTALICTCEKKYGLQWITPIECEVEKWRLWVKKKEEKKEGNISESPIHVPVHRERKALAGKRKVERKCDHKNLCISLSKAAEESFLSYPASTWEILNRKEEPRITYKRNNYGASRVCSRWLAL